MSLLTLVQTSTLRTEENTVAKMTDAEKERLSQIVTEAYEDSKRLIADVERMTEEERRNCIGLNSFAAIPVIAMARLFTSYTEVVNKLAAIGVRPTTDEADLIIRFGSIVAETYLSIEEHVAAMEGTEDTGKEPNGTDINGAASTVVKGPWDKIH